MSCKKVLDVALGTAYRIDVGVLDAPINDVVFATDKPGLSRLLWGFETEMLYNTRVLAQKNTWIFFSLFPSVLLARARALPSRRPQARVTPPRIRFARGRTWCQDLPLRSRLAAALLQLAPG